MRQLAHAILSIAVVAAACFPSAGIADVSSIGVVKLVNVGAYGTQPGASQREIFIRNEVFQANSSKRSLRARRTFALSTIPKFASDPQVAWCSIALSINPGASVDRLVVSFSRGALRFISGKMAKPGVQIVTPAVLIGIRGTDFTVTVDDIGNTAVAVTEGIVEMSKIGILCS